MAVTEGRLIDGGRLHWRCDDILGMDLDAPQRCEGTIIERYIRLCHPGRGEAFFEPLTHAAAIQIEETGYRRDCALDIVHNVARYTFIDDFGYRAVSEGKNGRTAGHGLDHHKAERFRPVDREKKSRRFAEEFRFVA